MPDPVSDYIAANHTYRSAALTLAPIISMVVRVANNLEHRPEQFNFSNTRAPAAPQSAMSRIETLDANEWPTAEIIQQALFNWQEAYSRVVQAWANVPGEAKGSLKEPEKPDSSVRYADRRK